MLVVNAVTRLTDALIRYSGSHNEMKVAVGEIIAAIRNKNVTLVQNNPKSLYLYGKVTTGGLVARMLDPALLKIFPNRSFVNALFLKGKYGLPLHPHLFHEPDYRALANLVGSIGDKYGIKRIALDTPALYQMTCSTIGLLGEVIITLETFGVSKNVKWCNFCFRHHSCMEHETTTDFDNYKRDHINYEKGRRFAKMLSPDVIERWNSQRRQRKLHGEDFKVDRKIKCDQNKLAFITQSNSWSSVLPLWEAYIHENYPIVSGMLDLKPESKMFWRDFVNEINRKLKNRSEFTFHPLWIIYMLQQAEDWFTAEQNFVDRRKKTDNLAEILAIYPSLTTKQSEVARMLNISQIKVSRALAKHKASISSNMPIKATPKAS